MHIASSPIPRYVVVADRLRKRIESGEWQAGHILPSLHQLAEAFGVARLTARQAVQILVREGLLESRRGYGTVVTDLAVPLQTTPLETSLRELGESYRSLVPRMLEFDDVPRPLPGKPEGAAQYIYMRRLHSQNGRPYCVISLYITQSVFALDPEGFRTKAVIPVMLENEVVHIAKASQTLGIGAADAEVASLLHIPVHAPVANVTRVFTAKDGTILYYAEVIYRGDAIRLEIDLKP